MRILHGYRVKDELRDAVSAIGIFDGIHLGHKKVIKKVINHKGKNFDKVIITFDPHPRSVLDKRTAPPRIMSIEHRLRIFDKMGIDAVIVINFSDNIANMDPEEFVRRVILGIGVKTVYVGADFRFGHGQSGDVDILKSIGRKYGIDVRKVDNVRKGGKIVSSTWVRKLVAAGKLKEAEKLLRRPVSILGTVVYGDERGRKLGIPTANIDPHQEVIPPPGVYAVMIDIEGKIYKGILNIGFNPTFYGTKLKRRKEPHIEAHILEFSGDLYAKHVEIFFIERLRHEKKFKNAQDLIDEIRKDKLKAEKLLVDPDIIRKIRKYKYL